MADDQVAAYLNDAQKRYQVFGESDAMPRLLAAARAVLDLHKPEGRQRTVERCERHQRDPWTTTAVGCQDCRITERVICWQSKCREEEWPCTEYRAISRALLGEEKAGA